MKTRFTTIDILATLKELQSFLGMRLINVYDIDNKTYLFKLSSKDKKAVLLMESGSRLHITDFEWPKNPAPSGFTMKLRKHIDNRRLESVKQLGIDRIVDLQFGSNEAAYHVVLELYDKGNIVLTDYQYTILNILRPRTDEDSKFVVRNCYPVDKVKQPENLISAERLQALMLAAKRGDNLKRVLNPHLAYGPALIEHVLLGAGFVENAKLGKDFDPEKDISRLLSALEEAENIMHDTGDEVGFIIEKKEKKIGENGKTEDFLVYQEFHPLLCRQHEKLPYITFPSFNKAVDEFFSKLEGQKLDMKALQMERDALKKLENVKKDHERRLEMLEKSQEKDKYKAQLIEVNLEIVDKAIIAVQTALANQISWKEIGVLIQEAQLQGDPVSKAIKALKLEINHITMLLSDPYLNDDDSGDDDHRENVSTLIDIDLDLSAYANAKKYYDMKRHAAKKEQKTIESSAKAYKSAEKKTKQALKDVATVINIKKARKVHWFEKFYWFVSSENFLVIGGRDQQQNELIVKRYLRSGDVYVHADLHGASSVVVKNPTGGPIPPKTLNEAGTMTVCYSSAWDAKVVTSAWWVHPDQVTKTAPTGEYLTTGSFMIRGKKNYLPPCHLIMGFGILFKLDDESVANHTDERKAKPLDAAYEIDEHSVAGEEIDVDLDEGSDENGEHDEDANPGDNQEISKAEEKAFYSGDHQAEEKTAGDETLELFPDTVIKLDPHYEEESLELRSQSVSSSEEANCVQELNTNTISLGDTNEVISERNSGSLSNNQSSGKLIKKCEDSKTTQQKILKRGQKYKLKKMKEKYKDQDDDDRQLAMELLKPAGIPKEPKHKKGKNKRDNLKITSNQPKVSPADRKMNLDKGKQGSKTNTIPVQEETEISDSEKEKLHLLEDAALLNSLTGIPFPEDVLLYSIPVCGPYNSMMNYKYKVKLTPGTGKRGKAAKTAIAMYLHDKSTTSREKDLIRSLKDQDVSRNIPGKVKMSAPQLQKLKK